MDQPQRHRDTELDHINKITVASSVAPSKFIESCDAGCSKPLIVQRWQSNSRLPDCHMRARRRYRRCIRAACSARIASTSSSRNA